VTVTQGIIEILFIVVPVSIIWWLLAATGRRRS
jgi:hypothetical protein